MRSKIGERKRWYATLLENRHDFESEDEIKEFEQSVQRRGYYPFRTDPDALAELESDETLRDELFHERMLGDGGQRGDRGGSFGWNFYYAADNSYWSGAEDAPVSAWPYPGLLAAFFFENPLLQLILVGLLSLWFFGWVGTVFLSSTRVVFATAFDRVLPEWVAKTSRNGVPYFALLLMRIPSIPISYLYAFGEDFATWTLNATLVISLTFFGSAIAAAILPWRKPEIYNASPIARYDVLGIPLVTIAAGAFAIFLAFCLYQWVTRSVYGINEPSSFLYLGVLYVLALVLYVVFRLIRRAQGMDLNMVYSEIPED